MIIGPGEDVVLLELWLNFLHQLNQILGLLFEFRLTEVYENHDKRCFGARS